MLLKGSHLYTKLFQVLHSDILALLLNQEIKFLSESEHALREVKHTDTVLNWTHSKRSADDILTMAEIHRLQSYWNEYGEQLPRGFDTLYASDQCGYCNQKHREKRFISALLKELCGVTRRASIFGRLISSVKKIGDMYLKVSMAYFIITRCRKFVML